MVTDEPIALQIDPAQALTFQLGEEEQQTTQCTLRLSNPGKYPCAFKVKTTKPKRYLVCPNQGKVNPGTTTLVSIVLLAQEKKLLLEEYRATRSTDDSNKFMVLSVPVGNAVGAGVDDTKEMPPEVWEQKHLVNQKRLVVQFTFLPPWTGVGGRQGGATTRVSELAGGARGGDSRLQTVNAVKIDIAAYRGVHPVGGGGGFRAVDSNVLQSPPVMAPATNTSGKARSSDQLWSQLEELRKKYDDLVNFTVNLTAEKDLIQRSLEATREDMRREQKARKQLESQMMEPGARRATTLKGTSTTQEGAKGVFSLFHLLLIAIAAIFAGQYLGRSSLTGS